MEKEEGVALYFFHVERRSYGGGKLNSCRGCRRSTRVAFCLLSNHVVSRRLREDVPAAPARRGPLRENPGSG